MESDDDIDDSCLNLSFYGVSYTAEVAVVKAKWVRYSSSNSIDNARKSCVPTIPIRAMHRYYGQKDRPSYSARDILVFNYLATYSHKPPLPRANIICEMEYEVVDQKRRVE